MDKALKHRVNAARVALRNQVSFFDQQRGRVASEWKADDTRVTFADFAISEKIFAELRPHFPKDQFLSEESGLMDEEVALESRYAWVLDPIDGTNNYALGMSACAISLALLKMGEPVYGLIYDGSTGEVLEGGVGQPLLVNGKRLVPVERSFDEKTSIVALHFPLPEGQATALKPLIENFRIRSMGSASLHLAYVALGRLDGAFDERVRVWDVAAAYALLQSAGREIRFLVNAPFPATTFQLQGPFIRYMAGSRGFLDSLQNLLGPPT